MKIKNKIKPLGVVCYVIADASNGSFLAYAGKLSTALQLQDKYLNKGIDTFLINRL